MRTLPAALTAFAILAVTAPAKAQPAAVPPPVAQAAADCVRPQYASDALVCSDPALRSLDAAVARLAEQQLPRSDDAIWESQEAWLRRRARCAFEDDHRGCLAGAYGDRQAVLAAARLAPTRALRCDRDWRGRSLAISAVEGGKPFVIVERGSVLGVASPRTSAWQPWLSWRRSGGQIILQSIRGDAFRCRLR